FRTVERVNCKGAVSCGVKGTKSTW
ncbi:unnamed protein product, partial [Allacma fusca]